MSTARDNNGGEDVDVDGRRKKDPNSNNSIVGGVVTVQKGTSTVPLNYSYDRNYYQSLLKRVNYELKTIQPYQYQYHPQSSSSVSHSNKNNILQEAQELANKVGLSIESDLRNINIVTATKTSSIHDIRLQPSNVRRTSVEPSVNARGDIFPR